MSSDMKRVFTFSALVLLAIALMTIWTVAAFRKADVLATHSAAASLLACLENTDVADASAEHWQLLNDAEYLRIITALKELGLSLDACPSCHTEAGLFGDAWGTRFGVAVRKRNDGHLDYIVWSVGRDRITGTEDDIIIPDNKSAEIRKLISK
jgi:hypothetical protein